MISCFLHFSVEWKNLLHCKFHCIFHRVASSSHIIFLFFLMHNISAWTSPSIIMHLFHKFIVWLYKNNKNLLMNKIFLHKKFTKVSSSITMGAWIHKMCEGMKKHEIKPAPRIIQNQFINDWKHFIINIKIRWQLARKIFLWIKGTQPKCRSFPVI